ncbi:MAG: CDP-alcohol phosphatidyltransferase family protein [Anaerolinea sp.]|nr:CDP-alcohol phosphatidyltransferase family protein [Anaerolinea sp.]
MPNNESLSIEMFLRKTFKGVLDAIATAVNKTGILPNTVTLLGLVGTTFGAYLLATENIRWGGLVILITGPIDALDGTMAKLRGEQTEFGAFVDSVTDRYSELIILAGLLIYYITKQDDLAIGLVYFAAAGSVLVSYVKARAESLGFTAKVGILTRVERYLVLAPALLINRPEIALWVIAIFANFTALQRIFFVRQQAKEQNKILTYSKKPD